MLRSKSLLSAALVLSVCSSACTPGSTNPVGNRAFNPAQTSDEIQPVSSVFGTSAMESFTALGGQFTPPGAAAATAPVRALAAAADDRIPFAAGVAGATRVMALELGSASRAELIPQEYWETTYVFVPGEGYQHDPERTDGPGMGMRFVLYAVDPVTGDVVEPLVETGHVDFIDESTDNALSVRLIVVSGETEYLNYTVTATGTLNAPVFTIQGFVTDGVDRIDFTLTNALVVTFAGARVDVDYQIDLANSDVRIVVQASFDENAGSLTVDGTISHGGQSARIQGAVSLDGSDEGQLEVSANGSLFATITIGPSSISAVGPDGQPLSQAEIDALEEILDVFGDTFDAFGNLVDPVEWLFPGE